MIHALELLGLTAAGLYIAGAVVGWVLSLFGISPEDDMFIPENGVRRDVEVIKRNLKKGTQ